MVPPYFADEREIIRILEAKGLAPIGPDGQLAFSFEDSGGEDDGLELYPGRDALQRIHSESFYGQTDIQLPDVQQRLRKTYDTVASPEQVCEFVHSALSRFGCIVSENDDGTYRIVVNEPNLQMADTDNTVERATFDPKVALDDPGSDRSRPRPPARAPTHRRGEALRVPGMKDTTGAPPIASPRTSRRSRRSSTCWRAIR